VTAGLTYGRRYLVSMSRLSGTGLRDRMTSGVSIVHETGTTKTDADGRDWGEIYQARPFGLGDTTYGVLTGGALGENFDTPAEWAAVSDGQFNIAINGTTKNCLCDFSGVETMLDVAKVIQSAIRASFPTATYGKVTCEFSTATNDHFIITSPNEGGSVGYTTLGDAGTDIGSVAMSCEEDWASPPATPAFSDPEVIGDITYPADAVSGTPQWHDNHASIYCSLDIGENGIDVLNGEGNNDELYVWNADIPIARAFKARESAGNLITLESGQLFSIADVGNTLVFADGTSTVIQYLCNEGGTQVYTDTSRWAVGNLGAKAEQGAAIGGGDVFTAVQAVSGAETVGASTITFTGYTASADDEGKTVFWSDGSYSHIVKFLTTATVEAAESTAVSSRIATMNPTGRKYNDTIPDYTLASRIGGEPLRQRFWQPVPQCNVGVIVNGFMFTAATNDTKVNYSQMPTYFEYLAGQHNEAYQYAEVKDGIQELMEFPDKVVVFCNHSTHSLPTNNYTEQTVPDVGEVVVVISGQTVADHNIGTTYGAIAKKDQNTAIVITREPAIRIFDGFKYGENLAADRLMKKLRALQAAYLVSYDAVNGFMFWGLDSTE